MEMTEIEFMTTTGYKTRVLKGDKVESIKNRLNNKKTKNTVLRVASYSLETYETISEINY